MNNITKMSAVLNALSSVPEGENVHLLVLNEESQDWVVTLFTECGAIYITDPTGYREINLDDFVSGFWKIAHVIIDDESDESDEHIFEIGEALQCFLTGVIWYIDSINDGTLVLVSNELDYTISILECDVSDHFNLLTSEN